MLNYMIKRFAAADNHLPGVEDGTCSPGTGSAHRLRVAHREAERRFCHARAVALLVHQERRTPVRLYQRRTQACIDLLGVSRGGRLLIQNLTHPSSEGIWCEGFVQ